MGLKRKRSSDYTYSPSSSSAFSVSSGGSSSPSPSPLQCHMAVPETGVQIELGFSVSKPFSYLGDSSGRTRKRWRNRPNEEAVYEHTIQKLFSAQREQPHAEPIMSHDQPHSTQQPMAPQKSTLHTFWNIKQRQPISTVATLPEEALGLRCDDCDRSLFPLGTMDLERPNSKDCFVCHACGRKLCDCCAVNCDGRRCLECAQGGRS